MTTWIAQLVGDVAADVAGTIATTWPFLLVSIIAAAAVSTYVGTDRVSRLLRGHVALATFGAVALATLTPFCSCGTMAVLLGMLATQAPWAPLVAFMVSSPLTSPSELLLSAGLFGWPFALTFFVGTIALGLAAGAVAAAVERTGWLRDQARVRPDPSCETGECQVGAPALVGAGPGTPSAAQMLHERRDLKLGEFARELRSVGTRLTGFFLAFTTIGYLVIEAIPTAWISEWLGSGSTFALPLAALLGIPAYVNTEASLPLVAALVAGGMSTGAALSFLVTGAGTSIGAIAGLLVIARRRVVSLVVALLFAGALAMGWVGAALL